MSPSVVNSVKRLNSKPYSLDVQKMLENQRMYKTWSEDLSEEHCRTGLLRANMGLTIKTNHNKVVDHPGNDAQY